MNIEEVIDLNNQIHKHWANKFELKWVNHNGEMFTWFGSQAIR